MSGTSTGTNPEAASLPPGRETRVVIVGGGVSGLATAFYLKQLGIRSTIVEETGRLGGLIRTDRAEGCNLEAGPDSFLATKTAVAELATDLGIKDQLIGSNDRERRIFVVRHGRLVEMPRGMVMMVPSEWRAIWRTSLVGMGTKWRFLRELSFAPRTRTTDFSIEEMLLQHFGREALQYLTEPLLSGVYGGSAAQLSAPSVLPRFVEYEAKYGSLIRGVRMAKSTSGDGKFQGKAVDLQRKTIGKGEAVSSALCGKAASGLFLSFEGGMQQLVETLVKALQGDVNIVFGSARTLRPDGGGWQVVTEKGVLEGDHVVLACPAHRSAELLRDSAARLAMLLADIPYSSSVLATLIFRRDQVIHPLNGFGFLVPPPERRTIAAATWINTKFPSRIADQFIAIRAFLVDPEAERCMRLTDEELTQRVLADLKQYMQIDIPPVYARVYRWPQSMPQYVVGHAARVSQIREQLLSKAGLHLASNFLDGVGIPDCVRQAKNIAESIAR